MKQAMARANANIALVKYWGKNDNALNIPAVSSLSMTLRDFGATVTVSQPSLLSHSLLIDDKPSSLHENVRLSHFLEQVRSLFPFNGFFQVSSKSSVPIAAGLASSSSFYAALACALNEFLALNLDQTELSKLARIGSGSAARSIFSGLVGLFGGTATTHDESYAWPLDVHPRLDLAMVLAIVSAEPKTISSREAMTITKNSSPFFTAFVDNQNKDFHQAIDAVKEGQFELLGQIMEHSTLKMFATMWTAQPPIIYWQPNTLALVNLVVKLRQKYGPVAYFTMDAGPNVKVLCLAKHLPQIITELAQSRLAEEIRCFSPGVGAHIVAEQCQ